MNTKKVSIIIRTYNEQKYLERLIKSILNQKITFKLEIIVVDSGSTDRTLIIAKKYKVKIINIKKKLFTYGRSLNFGCYNANGEILVFISGHCVPKNKFWLYNLIKIFNLNNDIGYVYGKQEPGKKSFFSEGQIYKKYFPNTSNISQDGFFCNNANAALKKKIWKKFKFDETLTGLEDIDLAKKIYYSGKSKIAYSSLACVYHYHNETWKQIFKRFERESLALQKIIPEIQINFFEFLKMTTVSIVKDIIASFKKRVFLKNIISIIFYRYFQYYGSYKGNKLQRKLSAKIKNEYFYPK
jgi:glycosyltransferase involved in cell wall biosynthesis